MDPINTHDVELAFEDLMQELSKLKDLNNLVDAYKDNVDALTSNISRLTEQIESYYHSANEHDEQVNILYNNYLDTAKKISVEIETSNQKFRKLRRRNLTLHIFALVLGVIACTGLAFLIFLLRG